MPNTYPTPPAYTPGAGQGGYWYRPPFTPRFSIPQTFGEALSYEAQIHWLANLCSDADAMLRTLSAMHFYYGTAPVDTSTFTAYEPFTYTDATVPEADQPKVGDFVGLVVPDADTRYLGKNALHIARVVEWGQPCNKLTLAWYCTVHDPTAWLADLMSQIGELEIRVTSLENRMTGAENRIETLEDTAARHGDAITALQTSIQNLTTAVTGLENDLTALTSTVNKHNQYIRDLRTDLTSFKNHTAKTLTDILDKVYGGGTIDPNTGAVTWGSGTTPIPVSTINIFSADASPDPASSAGLIAHAGVADNDLWQK
jgi:uncharacterized coiled-coil protein SlyX|uniref:Reovirus sigma C capsid protein n=1 Tax=Podoviridae sp. ctdxt3 TaxID=2825263 RepID=A0A8S5U8G6_9CAUD|nr:MAG TPA: Reovirus sigma C capsid protein [Podoviridae sp. ctdxt3]